MDLAVTINDILKPMGVPTSFLLRPEKTPCISFHFFDESPSLNGDGDSVIGGGKLQIDIFGKKSDSLRVLRKQAIELLTQKQDNLIITKTTPDECSYEDDNKLYHQVIVFNFIYDSEREVI